MALELHLPFAPMEALSVAEIPTGSCWQYEPKWDGFRCLVFRDGAKAELQSKSGRSLTRYFPELVAALQAVKAKAFVIDGEIVVPQSGGFAFDALLQRIHPASSRVKRLAAETPALLIVFDLLAGKDGRSLTHLPLRERRRRLETFASRYFLHNPRIRLSPATASLSKAKAWLRDVGATLDGIIAKRTDLEYRSADRSGMQKIKSHRSADCVVGGFRYNEGKRVVGSLLLGLYDDDGLLHHVGFTSTIPKNAKKPLTARLEKLIAPPGFTGNAPGGPSRWSTARSAKWEPLKAQLVVEVGYDHFTGGRFRHGTKLLRWRPDKSPRQCTMQQLKQKTVSFEPPRIDRDAAAERLDPAHEEQDEQDDNDEPEAAGRIVAPAAAVGPGWQGANENQNQDNQQDGAERHGRLLGPNLCLGRNFWLDPVSVWIQFP